MSFESHNAAISIEWELRRIFHCDRFGFGGNIDADTIERNPIQSYIIGLASIYTNVNEDRRIQIDGFLERILQYEGQSIEEIGINIAEQLTQEFKTLLD